MWQNCYVLCMNETITSNLIYWEGQKTHFLKKFILKSGSFVFLNWVYLRFQIKCKYFPNPLYPSSVFFVRLLVLYCLSSTLMVYSICTFFALKYIFFIKLTTVPISISRCKRICWYYLKYVYFFSLVLFVHEKVPSSFWAFLSQSNADIFRAAKNFVLVERYLL